MTHTPTKPYTLFLDSGAHSLYTREVIKKKHQKGYAYYDTKEFWDYVDAYAAFLKKYKSSIDYYVNVDVIFNPEMSWEVLKYMEKKHKLKPVPVIHHGTSLSWVERHLKEGYELLGIGGLGQEVTSSVYTRWGDQVFDLICDNPKRLPCVRAHGFAMTSYPLITRYPWWSVDSTTWVKAASYGSIYVPKKTKGEFNFKRKPLGAIYMSQESPKSKNLPKHYWSLSPTEKRTIEEWILSIDLPLGKIKEGKIVEKGVFTNTRIRQTANLRYFELLLKSLPEWPWSFNRRMKERLL